MKFYICLMRRQAFCEHDIGKRERRGLRVAVGAVEEDIAFGAARRCDGMDPFAHGKDLVNLDMCGECAGNKAA